jgi:hypothetical protein
MIRAKPIKDVKGRQAWSESQWYCWACGCDLTLAVFGRTGETHHIAKPGRSDELCNYSRLCMRDHMLAEGHTIRVGGVVLPKLTMGMVLTLKYLHDQLNWNPVRLAELYCRKVLPDFERIPQFFEEEWFSYRRMPRPSLPGLRIA